MRKVCLLSLVLCGLCAGLAGAAQNPVIGVPIAYQLPTDGPLPKTYRVTLAVTDPKNPDWIVSTFLAGAARTVTAENQGRFTDYWDGLDDNGMPLPPADYGVKGIYLAASKWEIDGQYHSIIPKYRIGAGESWNPTPDHDRTTPAIFNHCMIGMEDIQVGPNGVAGFLLGYLENGDNPFLVDLKKPIGRDQVIASYSSAGFNGGSTVACDGEVMWCGVQVDRMTHAMLYRADHAPFGETLNDVSFSYKKLPVAPVSMAAWRDGAGGRRFLYVALPAPQNQLLVIDGEKGATLATVGLKSSPLAVLLDRTAPGKRLLIMQPGAAGGPPVVTAIKLENGRPTGDWTTLFSLSGIAAPADCEMDSQGRFYVSDAVNGQVYQLGAQGKILRKFGKDAKQTPGAYDPHIFMTPRSLAVWTDPEGADRLLVVERTGPGRVSEWNPDGKLLREWFLGQNGNNGYCVDPARPEHLYLVCASGGLVRFLVDYEKGTWKVDAVWPDICRGDKKFPSGVQWPSIIKANGQKFLCFAGGSWNGPHLLYRQQGNDWIPAAGVVEVADGGKVQSFWWHDANGDGKVQPEEYQGNPASLPRLNYWADAFMSDLSLVIANRDTGNEVWRLAPRGFDAHGNPIFDGSTWKKLLSDTVLAARKAGTADPLHGGNELADMLGGWTSVAGTMEDGFYVSDNAGPGNPGGMDNAGSRWAQFKLSRYVPDGNGGFAMKWRVGRKAFRVANPGEVYGTQMIADPVYGIVGTFDSNGLYHLYTTDGLYVDTVMSDSFRYGRGTGGMYCVTGESWFGQHFLNATDKQVYLALGRNAATVYRLDGWTPGAVRPVKLAAATVVMSAGQVGPPNPFALALRGGAGKAALANFMPAPGGGPSLDGTMNGWEIAEPVLFGLDDQRKVEVHCMYDTAQIFLRWHVRTANPFTPVDMGDPTTIYAHDRGADFVSFYLQGDPQAAPGREEGRPGDVRIVFALVKDKETVRPIAVGMYPQWSLGGAPAPAKFTSPVSSVSFAHVGLIRDAKLGYTIDPDGKGFVIAAAIPKTAIPTAKLSGLRTQADFAATLGGNANFWWANVGRLQNATMTMDMPAEARLYPGAWSQAQFVGMDRLPVRNWVVCGPWGGANLKNRPNDPHPQTQGHNFTRLLFAAATYPPDDRKVDMKAVYKSPLTQDVKGIQREVRWTPRNAAGDTVFVCIGPEFWFAATWIYVPQDCRLECEILFDAYGSAEYWVNDTKLAGKTTYPGFYAPERKQTIDFHKGWNQVFMRGCAQNGAELKNGFILHGPEDLLWPVKVSPTPPAWSQAVGMDKLPIRDWVVCGPWGGENLKNRPNDPHPQTHGHNFTRELFAAATYPPDDRKVDMKALYKGPLTQDVKGVQRELRWEPKSTVGDSIVVCEGPAFAYAATWIQMPQDCALECDIFFDTYGLGQYWVNETKLAEKPTYPGFVEPVRKQTIQFRKGWNQVFMRGCAQNDFKLYAGLTLHGPEDLLRSVKVSPTPPDE
ncbi:MAG TPA: hypothetical protein VM238_03015 [Phycisphaerae bacterium]|nr:hypothetical protein [Phycisphaerae bacterium]